MRGEKKEESYGWYTSSWEFYGIDVNLHISWFVILLLLTWSLASNWFPQLFAGWSTSIYWLTAVQTRVKANLQGISVRQVMQLSPVTVPANISLQKVVNEYFLPQGIRAAPVLQGDYLAGLITLRDIARVERDRWASTPVGHVMRLVDQISVASPEDPLYEVLQQMVKRDINQVPVTQQGRLVGLVSRESILCYLHVRTSLLDEK